MNPKCTLPEEKRAEALQALTGWGLSLEEEKEHRQPYHMPEHEYIPPSDTKYLE